MPVNDKSQGWRVILPAGEMGEKYKSMYLFLFEQTYTVLAHIFTVFGMVHRAQQNEAEAQ